VTSRNWRTERHPAAGGSLFAAAGPPFPQRHRQTGGRWWFALDGLV